jgi:copper resistance protein B
MTITRTILTALVLLMSPLPVLANDLEEKKLAHEHGGQVFHAFRLETDIGRQRGEGVASWDLDGWVGTDVNKLWLKSEGSIEDGEVHEAELWALYSRNVSTYWDAQVGIRYDVEPQGHTFLALGMNGLAPYFFETEAHLFIRDDGALSARLRQENEWLLTNKLIMQPYAEVNLSGEDDPELGIGSGLTSGKIGLQTRYEFSRKFAPYFDISYEQKFGGTADYARDHGEDPDATTLTAGIRWLF